MEFHLRKSVLFSLLALCTLGFQLKASDTLSLNLTQEERQWLKEHPVIKVSSDPQWAPFEFIDKDGQFKGIHIEYLKIMERALGITFQPIYYDSWEEVYQSSINKDFDLLTSLVPTKERSQHLLFTKPIHDYTIALFGLEETPYIRSLSELEGKKVGVVSGYYTEAALKEKYPDLEVIPVKNIHEGLKKVHTKELYTFISGLPMGLYYLYKEGYTSIRVIGETPFRYTGCIAIRNDWPILRDIMQKAFESIPESEKYSIYQKWTSSKSRDFNYLLLLKLLSPAILIIILISYWNRRLRLEIRERKKLENDLHLAFAKLQDAQIHLVQNEKLASIGLFTAGIAHEIKNPVNFLMFGVDELQKTQEGFIQLIEACKQRVLNKYPEYASELESLVRDFEYENNVITSKSMQQHLHEGIDRITEITNTLNTFSRISDKDMVAANVHDGIETALVLLRSQYKYDIELVKNFGDLPEIKCYPGKLTQVFVNLIANAIQAIEQKGTIWLSTFMEENWVKVSVKDNGAGIAGEKLNEIFESFYTTKPIGKGTGLGLAISKNIIEEHKGKIEVNSELNVGTEFIVSLPV